MRPIGIVRAARTEELGLVVAAPALARDTGGGSARRKDACCPDSGEDSEDADGDCQERPDPGYERESDRKTDEKECEQGDHVAGASRPPFR